MIWLLFSCLFRQPTQSSLQDLETEYSGGVATVKNTSIHAYSLAIRGLDPKQRRAFAVGNAFFNDNWVSAPSSATGRDGLGPLFNAPSCSSCHFRDGRGRPPEDNEKMLSMLLQLSIPGGSSLHPPTPEPTYGNQLQNQAIAGVKAEGKVTIAWQEMPATYPDGTPYSLRKPSYHITDLQYGPLHKDVLFSPRVAPGVYGGGLLEAVSEASILRLADPQDRNRDGISGKPNWIWSVEHQREQLGRFGWKATSVSLKDQITGAFLNDIGITSTLRPKATYLAPQKSLASVPSGGSPEINENKLQRIIFYNQTLAVPARRDVNKKEIRRGLRLFHEIGCASCHTPTLQTDDRHPLAILHNQTIHPYTDLLLHDMGPELADNRPVFDANGREWRTPPLWGIGLVQVVNNHQYFLHDGRARGLEEAILWHGGEGKKANLRFQALSRKQRDAVLQFLGSL